MRAWSMGAGFITTLLLPILLPGPELGYYFAFASILALQVFFELGFNNVITQIAGHEAAELSVDNDGSLNGSINHLSRLASLYAITRRWYLIAAIFFVFIVAPTGFLFFGQNRELAPEVWSMSWLTLVLATGVNLYLSPRLALIEGCGKVGDVARLRLKQSVVGYACAWITLVLGGGLWAALCLPLASVIFTIFWLNRNQKFSRHFLFIRAGENTMSWRHDILPFQWRISVSWMSGYFIFNLLTPVIFASAGAIEAGRFGISMAIFTGLSGLSMSWLYANVAQFSRFASRGDLDALSRRFWPAALRSVGATIILCFLFVILVVGASLFRPDISARLLDLTDLSLLAIAVIANAVISTAATYMRSFREEPMLHISVVTAILTSCGIYFGSAISVTLMLTLYAGITAGITLPWTILVFQRHSKRHKTLISKLTKR